MKILDFIDTTKMVNMNEVARAKYLCFYQYKETGQHEFTLGQIADLMEQGGFYRPNISRLKMNLITGSKKSMTICKGMKTSLAFTTAVLERMEKEWGGLWVDNEAIVSSSEIIDESKFYGKRNYLDRLILQINHSYAYNCYDACAVLMRRLFEVLLILVYQNCGIDDEIKNLSGYGYLGLEKIVANAKSNKTLMLSRNKQEYDTFREVGNFSAHNITYIAGKKDIDDIKLNYRVMLEELYAKAELL